MPKTKTKKEFPKRVRTYPNQSKKSFAAPGYLTLLSPEAAPEETMQLRRLNKRSNESLGPYLFGVFEFLNL